MEGSLREFYNHRDAADEAIGRFELSLQVYRPKDKFHWVAGLAGLATALSLRWRGDRERSEAESLRHFRRAVDAASEHDADLAALVRARLGFCSQYLRLPLPIARTELGF